VDHDGHVRCRAKVARHVSRFSDQPYDAAVGGSRWNRQIKGCERQLAGRRDERTGGNQYGALCAELNERNARLVRREHDHRKRDSGFERHPSIG